LSVHESGVSVPEVVRLILTKSHATYECLKMKLINFQSLTEPIQVLVQGATGRKASVNSLVVAIKRFSDTLPDIKVRINRTCFSSVLPCHNDCMELNH
jgi:hypothetical protein